VTDDKKVPRGEESMDPIVMDDFEVDALTAAVSHCIADMVDKLGVHYGDMGRMTVMSCSLNVLIQSWLAIDAELGRRYIENILAFATSKPEERAGLNAKAQGIYMAMGAIAVRKAHQIAAGQKPGEPS
jgi:hypothetical protein